MTTIETLRGSSLDALEALYREAPMGPPPAGRFRGTVLRRVPGKLTRSLAGEAILAPFERLRFGIDFEKRLWWFLRPGIAMGRFRVDPGPSRWRGTDTLRLRYDVSRLPIRAGLYDEVKPLSATLCLGLGGINADEGLGDLFYFALERA